ncbi:hypothetical protein EMIHUDRAFT_221694 [Emiliania huxleyi CCMP1516]|uniref:Choline/carnitine acyltransferase domain-containing protein n=2 Tax=Emiliania huxleyi TaxID=2903 RepID=A0A0D3HY22_EMIH1|nr:hypothetical protein EMIHUDRAFT_221694 [Emiliania huxleyi CCMP1516]EOD03907.1 hypothetical protein EMIHUDRAFT_221694 [Emiliania huxleyi CCMP1516]|eukprot:XP_005756336.1 hypothetical protein EMIHUDRAFT_221694 [Emiliania huxleyi CCMP1516]
MHPSSVGARSAWWVAAGSEPGAASAAPPQLHEAYAEHQAELPRLPIPPLDETLERFMRAATPLLALRGGTAAVNDAAAMVASFGAAEGAALDSKLREWDEGPARDGSYLESAWYRLAYLGSRVPVPINSNPAMVLREPAGSEGSQLWRAATLLAGAAEFAAELRSGSLPAASARGIPFCMSMFPAVLGTARLPETGCDRMRCSPSSTHAAVGWRGEWYSLPLFGADGARQAPRDAAEAE